MIRKFCMALCLAAGTHLALAQQAAAPPAPDQPAATPVAVRDGAYQAFGQNLASLDELMALLKERHATAIVIAARDGDDYERIGRLIYTAHRFGIAVSIDTGTGK